MQALEQPRPLRLSLLFMACLLLTPSFAEEAPKVRSSAEWKVAEAEFERDFGSSSPARRLKAVKRLGDRDYIEAVELLVKILAKPDPQVRGLTKELAEAQAHLDKVMEAARKEAETQGGKILVTTAQRLDEASMKRSSVHARLAAASRIQIAAEEGLSKTEDAEAVAAIIEFATEHRDDGVRAACVRALGNIGGDAALDAIRLATEDEETVLRIAAAQGLGKLLPADAGNILVALLDDEAWQVRAEAVRALAQIQPPEKSAAKPLIDRMGKEVGRLREDIDETLRAITGADLRGDHEQWASWWAAKGEEWLRAPPPRPKDEDEATAGEGDSGEDVADGGEAAGEDAPPAAPLVDEDDRTVSFYGIRTQSKRILFVLDVSCSMAEPAGREFGGGGAVPTGSGHGAGERKGLPPNPTRLDVAKYELKRAINGLEEKALFNVLAYSDDCALFKKKMIKADDRGKKLANKQIDLMEPIAGTNIHDALEQGFIMAGRDDKEPPEDGIDTIFFLSDGKPTVGKLVETGAILDAVAHWNRDLGIKVHVIGVGAGHDQNMMRTLAERGGGKYVAHE